jgi:hypothetical protein
MLGMTGTANERLIYLDDILGEVGYGDIEHRDGKALSVNVYFKTDHSRLAFSRSTV